MIPHTSSRSQKRKAGRGRKLTVSYLVGSVSGFAVPGAAIVQLQSGKHQEAVLRMAKVSAECI